MEISSKFKLGLPQLQKSIPRRNNFMQTSKKRQLKRDQAITLQIRKHKPHNNFNQFCPDLNNGLCEKGKYCAYRHSLTTKKPNKNHKLIKRLEIMMRKDINEDILFHYIDLFDDNTLELIDHTWDTNVHGKGTYKFTKTKFIFTIKRDEIKGNHYDLGDHEYLVEMGYKVYDVDFIDSWTRLHYCREYVFDEDPFGPIGFGMADTYYERSALSKN